MDTLCAAQARPSEAVMPKQSKQQAAKTNARLDLRLGRFARVEAFDDVSVQIAEPSSWRHWFELVAILAAFLAGAASILTFAPHFGTSLSQTWKVVLIAAATLCVGFGVAALFYGRLREQETRALRADFQNLRSRADALVAKFDDFERSKRAS